MTDRKDFPQYNPTKSSLWNFKYAYEQGKFQREKEILEIIEIEYPNLIDDKDRYNFIKWKQELKSKIKGEGK